MKKHTILGAGGTIAYYTAQALHQDGKPVRLVSRAPQAIDPTDELVSADLLNAASTRKAVAGSEVVYLTAGLPYKAKIWVRDWPILMKNTIEACRAEGAKLVFFSNVYALGLVTGPMTEDLPLKPNSQKGQARAQVEQMLLDEMKKGDFPVVITRAADFYGPHTNKSAVNLMIIERLAQGKAAQVLVSDSIPHSYSYVPDMGRAMALLGQRPEADNQIWHLPTMHQGVTGKELVERTASLLGTKPKYSVVSKFMLRIVGLFNADVAGSLEMLYQFEHPYQLESRKFEAAFGMAPTPLDEGLHATIGHLRQPSA